MNRRIYSWRADTPKHPRFLRGTGRDVDDEHQAPFGKDAAAAVDCVGRQIPAQRNRGAGNPDVSEKSTAAYPLNFDQSISVNFWGCAVLRLGKSSFVASHLHHDHWIIHTSFPRRFS